MVPQYAPWINILFNYATTQRTCAATDQSLSKKCCGETTLWMFMCKGKASLLTRKIMLIELNKEIRHWGWGAKCEHHWTCCCLLTIMCSLQVSYHTHIANFEHHLDLLLSADIHGCVCCRCHTTHTSRSTSPSTPGRGWSGPCGESSASTSSWLTSRLCPPKP